MKKIANYTGIIAICLGIGVLAVDELWTTAVHNILLFLALFLIIGGVIAHIVIIKKKSKY